MGNKGCYGCLYFDPYDDNGYGFCDYHEKWVKSSNSYGCGGYTYSNSREGE